jgi:hypothetical protein
MSGIGSAVAAAALLPKSLSGVPLAPARPLLLRVRVVRSRDISIFLFVRAPHPRAWRALESVQGVPALFLAG